MRGTGANGKPEKIFYIRYRKDGKQIEEKAGRQFQDDMTAARASHSRAERILGRQPSNLQRRESERQKNEKFTISRLWEKYGEAHAVNKGLHAESLKFDRYLRGDFGDKEPNELVAEDVTRLGTKLQKQGKLTTAARVLEILRRTINYGIESGKIPPIAFKINVPKLNNEITEDLSEEQIQSLLKALEVDPDQRAANIMRMAMFTGMRRSEILKLRWENLDFNRGFIRIVNPKGGKDQVIPMNDSARLVLSGIGQTNGNPYVFPGKLPGTHLTECRRSCDRIRAAAGLPKDFRPLHGLRHVFASMLASSGQVDMYVIQKLLTHKSPLMTQRYAHLRDDSLRKASDLAGELIGQASDKSKSVEKLP